MRFAMLLTALLAPVAPAGAVEVGDMFPLPVDGSVAFPDGYPRGRISCVLDNNGDVHDISRGMPEKRRIPGILDKILHGGT